MSLFDFVSSADKYPVVLDIGHAYTKIGFARELGPRFIIPSEVKHPLSEKVTKIWSYNSKQELYVLLKEYVHKLYFNYLVVNPKDRRVVVVESIFCPTTFRETLANVLFTHFEIPSLLFVPSHLMSLFTLNISTALVLDTGYSETVVLPIYEEVPILGACQMLPVGGEAIHRRIEAELMEKAMVKMADPGERPLGEVLMEMKEPLPESVLEDVKVRTCFVTPRSRGIILQAHDARKRTRGTGSPDPEPLEMPSPPQDVSYPLQGCQIMTIPGTLREWAPELLFEQDADDHNIATLILDAILKCPIDTRKALANNVIVMGGTSMLPGFKHSLLTEIKILLGDPRYSSRLPLKEIKFHNPPAKENYVAWLGASIFGSTDALVTRSMTKERYSQVKCMPDWSDQMWLEHSGKSIL